MIIYIFRFISAFAVVAYHDITFAAFAFLGMPASLILSKTLMRRMVNNNRRSAAMGAKMSGFNQETFSNIQTIKAFDLVGNYSNKLKNLQKEYISMRLEFQRMSMGTNLILSLVNMLVTYSAYAWGIYRVWNGDISYGTMTMFLGLSGTLTGTLHNLTSLVPTAIGLTTSAGRLMDILDMPREDYSHRDEVTEFWARNKDVGVSLKIKELAYTYKTGTEVFAGASLEAKPGEIVALVGPSGEGKTTMLRILLGLVYVWEGTVSVQDPEGMKVPVSAATRGLFSYVPQDNVMFAGSVAENMRMMKEDATDEQINEALRKACAYEFVHKIPTGLQSPIRENGGGFSEGQIQRLAIARALLSDAPVLLFDEATSALDVATERKILRNVLDRAANKTCIITTHRPSVLSMCDRIYRISDGKMEVMGAEAVEKMIMDF